jgi:transglutaminase/protease-like cytokinesis protein 3
MLQEGNNKVAGDKDNRVTPQKKMNQNAPVDTSTDNTATKKRTRDDMMMGEMNIGTWAEGPQIEKLLQNLKNRVLNGETLNNFKKEIAQVALLIEKGDNQQLFEKTVYFMA